MDTDILQAHKRRLKFLEIRAAEMGRDTPSHILMEIEDIQRILKNVHRIGQLDCTKAIRVKRKMVALMQSAHGCQFLLIQPQKNSMIPTYGNITIGGNSLKRQLRLAS